MEPTHSLSISGHGEAGVAGAEGGQDTEHDSGGMRLEYQLDVPLWGTTSVFVKPMLGFAMQAGEKEYLKEAGMSAGPRPVTSVKGDPNLREARSSFTSYQGLIGGSFSFSTELWGRRFFAEPGSFIGLGAFESAPSTLVEAYYLSDSFGCIGDCGYEEIPAGLVNTGTTGLIDPEQGISSEASGFILEIRHHVLLGVEIFHGDEGTVSAFAGPETGITLLMNGYRFVDWTHLGGTAGLRVSGLE